MDFRQAVSTISVESARIAAFGRLSNADNEQQLNQFSVIQESCSHCVNAAEGAAAHDFNDILTVILGNMDLLDDLSP